MKIISCDCFEELCKELDGYVRYDAEPVPSKPTQDQKGLGGYDVNLFRDNWWWRAYWGIGHCPFCGEKIEVEEEDIS